MKLTRPAADKTRKTILKAAEKWFAKQGFSGASISKIAASAKINQSLIYHHFGSKEKLWREVKFAMAARYYGVFELVTDKGLRTFLEQTVKVRVNFLRNNPNVLRIIQWQRLEPKQLFFGIAEYRQKWREAVITLQQQGEMREDIDPDMASLFISSAVQGVFEEANAVFQGKNKEEKQVEYINFVVSNLYIALKR